jgi:signal transduction histidine kinase
MSPFQRYRWFIAAAGITAAFGLVSLFAHPSLGLTAFSDIAEFLAMLVAAGFMLANALARSKHERSFWALMSLGFLLWMSNQASWIYCELVLHKTIPDPYFFDILLFFHLVPMIAATGWRPDLGEKQAKFHLSTLNFLMLLGWWIFLYAFLVFPHQYIRLNLILYNRHYDRLYLVENVLWLAWLGFAALTSVGGWRRLYLHFLAAGSLYAIGSQFLDRAAVLGKYYSGSLYDVPLVATIVWMAAASISIGAWDLDTVAPEMNPRWKKIPPRLAMIAMLSLPVLGLWTAMLDTSTTPSRVFRLFVVLVAMIILGALVFLRQYVQDQAVMRLLQNSRKGYENQKRLQGQLVQKEKLASLGNLVAGAAHEINHPLVAVMNHSEQLWAQGNLTDEQNTLVRKIVNQAGRTRDLVSNLLSFAQQSPGEKALLDLGSLLSRATQMLDAKHAGGNIRIEIFIEPGFPRVRGNVNQLFQALIEIVENAIDALQESGGGRLEIRAQRLGHEVVLQFSDTGPGIREPQRVFDPFYTTKPVGKGTGLGLSAVYGVVQDHNGQITCQNKPEGGALFIMRFPAAEEPLVQAAVATQG